MSSGLLSKKVMESLGRHVKKSDLEIVTDYFISEPGVIVLTPEQELIKERLEFIDNLFAEGSKNIKQMSNIVAKRFGKSTMQGRRYVEEAEFVFGSIRRTNKAHRLFRHIDRLEAMLISVQTNGQLEFYSKIADSLTKAIALLPEDKTTNRNPTTIVMNITQNNINQISSNAISEEEAEQIVMKKLEAEGITLNQELTPYELEE